MSRIPLVRLFSVLALAFVASASSAATITYEVGTCMPGLPSYPTISAALGATPPADVIKVCPGTYHEQVAITQPVTLEGVSSADSAQAIIAVPSGGLVVNASSSFGPIAAQLLVDNASGLVNVSDLTVDGTGNGVGAVGTGVAGIVYQNSGGTVNRVATRNQSGNGSGVGILAVGGSSNPSVTIENASVHDFDVIGIEAGSDSSATLSVAIKGNEVTTTAANSAGIYITFGATVTVTSNLIVNPGFNGVVMSGGAGTISRNTVMNAGVGILASFSVGTISDNTVMNSGVFGIDAEADGVSVTSNKIFGSATGIRVITSVAAVQNNTITKSPIGIDFQCNANPNVFSNIVTDAGTGLNSVPSTIGPRDTYFNVGTIRTGGC